MMICCNCKKEKEEYYIRHIEDDKIVMVKSDICEECERKFEYEELLKNI